jgi:hypothetical protein
MTFRLTLSLLLLTTPALADDAVFRLADPKGDDHGTGALIYPNRPDMQPGDLDLVEFSARHADGGTWFTVEFARPIRDPRGEVTAVGQQPVEKLARNGFYTFNVDVYVDRDRVAGSGRTQALPGRNVDIDRNFAWEKAIIVSPRQDIARTLLELHLDTVYEAELRATQGRVGKADVEAIQARSQSEVADFYLFPNQIRVRGRRLEFFVSASDLGGQASPEWAYTVLVTGADIEQLGRVGFNPTNRPKLMTMPVTRGIKYDSFGLPSDADINQAPVVDLLAAEPGQQEAILDDYDVIAGRLAQVPGVAPDGRVATVSPGGAPVTPASAQRVDQVARSTAPASPAGTAGTTAAAPAAPNEAAPAQRTVPARLRTLNQLREEGLVTEEEYGELRRKILSEL